MPHLPQDRDSAEEGRVGWEKVLDVVYQHAIRQPKAMRNFCPDALHESDCVWLDIQVFIANDLRCENSGVQVDPHRANVSESSIPSGWSMPIKVVRQDVKV
jgi:hypothetical protein